MNEEYYHKDLFGAVVDVNISDSPRSDLGNLNLRSDLYSQGFNIFSLTDAIGARDKRRAWTLYMQALAAGLSAEEVFFKVVWQVKSMLIALKTKSVSETDMKPFPYSKAKGFLENWKDGELENLSEALVLGYHRIRRGEGETETLVERIILNL